MKKTIIAALVIGGSITLLSAAAYFLYDSSQPVVPPAEPPLESPKVTEEVEVEVAVADTSTEPNVLLIILDDIGLDYFPGYLEGEGFTKARMPNMQSLIEEGYLFTNLNTYAMCSPTRASLITGHHGVDTGVLDPGTTAHLDPSWQSIQHEVKELSDDAITSAVIGKWHIMSKRSELTHPNEFVDYYAGIPTGNHESYFSWNKVVNGEEIGSDVYATTDFTNEAINWIAAQDGQWFTWLAYTAPHDPIHLPPSDLHTYELSEEEQDIRRNGEQYFMAMLESVDTEIGRLISSLSREDRENTYIIVIGDNGTGGKIGQEPFKSIGMKGSLHVGGIHTPMIVYSPYQNGAGQEISELVSTIDFFPTILDIFALESSRTLPGNSFYPLLTNSPQGYQPNEYIFSQNLEATTVRSQTHRLIRNNSGTDELYDLTVDPYEERNLLARSLELSTEEKAHYTSLTAALEAYLEGTY